MSKEPTLCLSRRRGTACTFTHVFPRFVCDCGMPHARMGPGCRNRRRARSFFGPACPLAPPRYNSRFVLVFWSILFVGGAHRSCYLSTLSFMIHYRSTFIHASFYRTCGEVYTRTACASTQISQTGHSNGSDTPRSRRRPPQHTRSQSSSCNENDKNQDEGDTPKQAQRDLDAPCTLVHPEYTRSSSIHHQCFFFVLRTQ